MMIYYLVEENLKNRKMIGGRHLNTGMTLEDAVKMAEERVSL